MMTVGSWVKRTYIAKLNFEMNHYLLIEISGERYTVMHWPTGLLTYGLKWNFEPSEQPLGFDNVTPIRQWSVCSI